MIARVLVARLVFGQKDPYLSCSPDFNIKPQPHLHETRLHRAWRENNVDQHD
ncbi:MAG: hypothetical protein ABL893_08470 [Hyphomicrobium sp.]